jgi:hypothetical protein
MDENEGKLIKRRNSSKKLQAKLLDWMEENG